MELFFLWLGSFFASVALEWNLAITVANDIGKQGYKLKKGFKEKLADLINSKTKRKSKKKWIKLVPMLNVLNSLDLNYKYLMKKEVLLELMVPVLEEMTQDEKEKFNSETNKLFASLIVFGGKSPREEVDELNNMLKDEKEKKEYETEIEKPKQYQKNNPKDYYDTKDAIVVDFEEVKEEEPKVKKFGSRNFK